MTRAARRAWAAIAALAVAAAVVAVFARPDVAAPPAADADAARRSFLARLGDTPAVERVPSAAAPAPRRGLAGLVVDAAGVPVPLAEVSAVALATAGEWATRSDARGAFALPDAPSMPLRLVARHPDYLLANLAVDAAPADGLRVVLHRRPTVRGRVLDARGAKVARFCAVLARLEDGVLFAVSEPPPGAVWMQRDDATFALVADDVGPHALQVFTERGIAAQVRLDLSPDAVVQQDVEIAGGVRARGIVRDVDGEVIAGARVDVRALAADASGCIPGAQAITQPDGTFALPPLPSGTYTLVVEPIELPMLRRSDLMLDRAQPEPFFELQLPADGAAAGAVQPWREGQRAEVVFVHPDGPVRRAPVDAVTGTFAIGGLLPGVQRAHVERLEPSWRNRVARHLLDAGTAPRVEVVAGVVARVDLPDVTATMARVRGRVVGRAQPERCTVRAFREDAPLPEAVAGLYRAAPAADGAFELDGFVPGRWRLQLMFGDTVLAWDLVELAADADVEFVLHADGR